jgi:hypothetical protein
VNTSLRELLQGSGDFKIGGYVICTVKCVDDLTVLAKEEMILQSMIDRLIDTGRCCGMETNAEKSKVMRISREPSRVQIMLDQKQLENVEYTSTIWVA